MKKKELKSIPTWIICILFALWPLYGIPLIIGIILLLINRSIEAKIQERQRKHDEEQMVFQNNLVNGQIELQAKLDEIGAERYDEVTKIVAEIQNNINNINHMYSVKKQELDSISEKVGNLVIENEKLQKKITTETKKLSRMKELYDATQYSVNQFHKAEVNVSDLLKGRIDSVTLSRGLLFELEELAPTVTLHLHSMDVKDLKAEFTNNDKNIQSVLEAYSSSYTTKANKSIYSLMTIALRAELQNVLTSLKYEKLDVAEESIRSIIQKYIKIVGEGNQSIAGTLQKFIKEIEYLFLNAVKIEYMYFVRREQQREEQARIREQMRLEAEERKKLEAEKKKVEQEEAKYQAEINKLLTSIEEGKGDEQALKNKVEELQQMLQTVEEKKEKIIELQNGKAGYVYVISNLGSFGESMFKVGMTRRSNPQDRIDELGDASVPFRFDVHALVFSEDASSLETKLHQILNDKRVNKVNMRKEFFYSTVDELQTLVQQIDPTAEFTTTMAAIEYRQSQSTM